MTSSVRSQGAALILLVFVAVLLVGPRPAAAQFLFQNRWINPGTGDGYDREAQLWRDRRKGPRVGFTLGQCLDDGVGSLQTGSSLNAPK